MHPELLWSILVAGTTAGSAAILAVLALRQPIRALFGARVAYALWALVPIALMALTIPASTVPRVLVTTMAASAPSIGAVAALLPSPPALDVRALLVGLWAVGAFGMVTLIVLHQFRFARGLGVRSIAGVAIWRAGRADVSPMVVGLWNTRIVLPADFEQRFDADEQRLVLAHEHAHLRGQDVRINALAALLLALSWPNPLAWLAWRTFRFDQELACDALVIERHPTARRTYANAMLKAQLDHGLLPLGCHWSATHPLHRRIQMIARKSPTTLTRMLGRAVVAALALGFSYSIWAQKPAVAGDVSPSTVPARMLNTIVITEVGGHGVVHPTFTSPGDTGHVRVSHDRDGDAWTVDLRVRPDPQDDAVAIIDAVVEKNGAYFASPSMKVHYHEKTTVTLTRPEAAGATADGDEFRLTTILDRSDQPAQTIEIVFAPEDRTAERRADGVRYVTAKIIRNAAGEATGMAVPDNGLQAAGQQVMVQLVTASMAFWRQEKQAPGKAMTFELALREHGAGAGEPGRGFSTGERDRIESGVAQYGRGATTGRISLGAKELSIRDAFLSAAALAKLRVVDTTLLSTTQRVDFELNDVPPEVALSLIADASNPPFQYAVQDGAITLSR